MTSRASLRTSLRTVRQDRRGLALVEFAFALPILMLLCLTGAEIVNYITTRMRISQLALHIADNAARMGTGPAITAKSVSETDINDVLTGGGLQAGDLNLYANGRVVLTDLEPVANPNTTDKYKVGWIRCRGAKSYTSPYARVGQTNMVGIGPADTQVKAQDFNATMFVEVTFTYTPLVLASLAPSTTITEIASMAVRDRRDLTQIYNLEGAAVSTC